MNSPWLPFTPHSRPPPHHQHRHKLRSATPSPPRRPYPPGSAPSLPRPASALPHSQPRDRHDEHLLLPSASASGEGGPGFVVDYKAIQRIADGVERMVMSWSNDKSERAKVYANAYHSLHAAAEDHLSDGDAAGNREDDEDHYRQQQQIQTQQQKRRDHYYGDASTAAGCNHHTHSNSPTTPSPYPNPNSFPLNNNLSSAQNGPPLLPPAAAYPPSSTTAPPSSNYSNPNSTPTPNPPFAASTACPSPSPSSSSSNFNRHSHHHQSTATPTAAAVFHFHNPTPRSPNHNPNSTQTLPAPPPPYCIAHHHHGALVHYDPHHNHNHHSLQTPPCDNSSTMDGINDEDCDEDANDHSPVVAADAPPPHHYHHHPMQNARHHHHPFHVTGAGGGGGGFGIPSRKFGGSSNDHDRLDDDHTHDADKNGSNNPKGDSYEAKVKELEISLLECATEYEVQIVEMKMKMLQMKSEFRQKGMEEKPTHTKPFTNITNVNAEATKQKHNKQSNFKHETNGQGLQKHKKIISNTNGRPRSQQGVVLPKKLTAFDQEKDVLCLQKLLNKKEQELTNSKHKEKVLATQIHELQALVQRGRVTQIEPKKLLSLLLALNEWLQSIKAGVVNGDPQIYHKAYQNVHALAHLRMNFAANSPNANRSPQLENIASIVNKEIKTLQDIVGKLNTQKKSETKKRAPA